MQILNLIKTNKNERNFVFLHETETEDVDRFSGSTIFTAIKLIHIIFQKEFSIYIFFLVEK